MTDLRTASQRLLDAIDRALPEAPLCSAFDVVADTADDLRAALAQPEDKSQAAFEHWVETVEATQGCAISRNAVADAGSIIKPEIKGHNVEPPPEAQTEAEKIAYCAGWWAAMAAKQNLQGKLLPWKGLTEEEHNYYKALGFVGVKAVEEKLRAKNSTLVPKN